MLSSTLPRGTPRLQPGRPMVVGVLEGEGIGPEVVPAALDLLHDVTEAAGIALELRHGGLIGKPALARHGTSLSEEVVAFSQQVFDDGGALFCGAGGERFVYELRARFDLFCKFTPLRPIGALRDAGPLRPQVVEAADIIAVRDNSAGLYLGQWGMEQGGARARIAHHSFQYREDQVERIIEIAVRLARQRRGKLSVTTKPGGVPSVSALWHEVAARCCEASGVRLQVLEVDNAVYQLIADPAQFDVIVSPNMFGDVMADCGALLLGSRGMSFSGNFSPEGWSVFQTGHGAAHDLAGTDRANPVGQMLALAMMLREGFGLEGAAGLVESAVETVLRAGVRTADVAAPQSLIVGTREFARRVRDALRARLNTSAPAQGRAA